MPAAVDKGGNLDGAGAVPSEDGGERDAQLHARGHAGAGGGPGGIPVDARNVAVVDRHLEAVRGVIDEDVAGRRIGHAAADVRADAAALRQELREVRVERERVVAAGAREVEVRLEAGIELQAGERVDRVRTHAIEAVEVDVGVVAAQGVLATRLAIDEHIELVEVALQVAGDHQVEVATRNVDGAVDGIDFAAVAGAAKAIGGVAEAGADRLDAGGDAVRGFSRAVDDNLGVSRGAQQKRRRRDQKGLHFSGDSVGKCDDARRRGLRDSGSA